MSNPNTQISPNRRRRGKTGIKGTTLLIFDLTTFGQSFAAAGDKDKQREDSDLRKEGKRKWEINIKGGIVRKHKKAEVLPLSSAAIRRLFRRRSKKPAGKTRKTKGGFENEEALKFWLSGENKGREEEDVLVKGGPGLRVFVGGEAVFGVL